MSIRVKIVYKYYGNVSEKWVDPNKYGYIDMVNDIWNSVLCNVEEGKNVTFLVKCVLPDGVEEMIIASDKNVMQLIEFHEAADKIVLIVYQLQLSEPVNEVYTINNFPSTLVGRGSRSDLVEGDVDNIIGSLESVTAVNTIPAKAPVRRGRGRVLNVGSPPTNRSLLTKTHLADSTADRGERVRRGTRESARVQGTETVGRESNKEKVKVYSKSIVLFGEGSSAHIRSGAGTVPTRITSQSGVVDNTHGKNNRTSSSSASMSGSGDIRVESNSNASPTQETENQVDEVGNEEEGSDKDCYPCDTASDDEDWNARDEDDVSSDDEEDENESEKEEKNNPKDSGDELSDYKDDEGHNVYGNEYYLGEDSTVKLEKGMVFESVHQFRSAVRDFAVQEGFETDKVKNEPERVTLRCKKEGCCWRIHASPADDFGTFMIKTFNPKHTCEKVTKNSAANSTWIAKKLEKHLRADPDMKQESMVEALRSMRYHIQPGPMQLYRARKHARGETKSFHSKCYAQLPAYGHLLLERNPGSVFKLKYYDRPDQSGNPIFMRMFVYFAACRQGFVKGCRPFIGLDGCHLKGIYKGVLLAAISLDGNNSLFPLAVAVVEAECKDSWVWFLEQLHLSIQMSGEVFPLAFMSDKQKGLAEPISQTFPDASHRFCCRHLYNNFKVKFSGVQLRSYFWAAAKAPNEFLFNKAMDTLKSISQDGYDWLQKNPSSMWARHAFDFRIKSDHITNNMSESFNQWISTLRGKSILILIDELRIRIMSRIQKRYEKGCTYKGKVTPRIKKILEMAQEDSRFCLVTFGGGDEYEVKDGFTRFVVNLKDWTCGCKRWEGSGVPCKHAAAAIREKRADIEDFCSPYYSTNSYLLAHEDLIHPLPDLETLEIGDEGNRVQPPPFRRLPGRPHRNRRREPDEGRPKLFRRRAPTVRCDICKGIGHNRRTCQRAPIAEKGKSSRQPVQQKRKSDSASTSTTPRVTRSQSANSGIQTRSINVRRKTAMGATT